MLSVVFINRKEGIVDDDGGKLVNVSLIVFEQIEKS
jgi:hypothetical protein